MVRPKEEKEPVAAILQEIHAERDSHPSKGYTAEHDRRHGLSHLLIWAKYYIGFSQNVDSTRMRRTLIKAASVLVAAIQLLDEKEEPSDG